MDFLRKLWAGWKKFGQAMGDFVARLILTVFYFTIYVPFGLGMRLFSNRLDLRGDSAETPQWTSRTTTDNTIEDGLKQS